MPVNECPQTLPIFLPFSEPPMRSDYGNPVQFCVSSACERSITSSVELLKLVYRFGLPAPGVSYFHNKDSSKGEGGHRQLHYLDSEMNEAFWAVWTATLWGDYVPLFFFFFKSEFVFRGAYKAVQRRSCVVHIVLRHCKVDVLSQRELAMCSWEEIRGL